MLKKDICVIGIGRFGQSIITELYKLKRHVLAIDKDEEKVQQMSKFATNVAIVDATNTEALSSLSVQDFNTIIVAASDNIDVVATLMELGVDHIIAKATSERNARVLRQIGVHNIVFPEQEAGVRTAVLTTHPAFLKYSTNIQDVGDGVGMVSVKVLNRHWVDRPLMQLKFPKLAVNVVSIKRKSQVILPNGKTIFRIGDILTLIGRMRNLARSVVTLQGDENDEEIIPVNKNKLWGRTRKRKARSSAAKQAKKSAAIKPMKKRINRAVLVKTAAIGKPAVPKQPAQNKVAQVKQANIGKSTTKK